MTCTISVWRCQIMYSTKAGFSPRSFLAAAGVVRINLEHQILRRMEG